MYRGDISCEICYTHPELLAPIGIANYLFLWKGCGCAVTYPMSNYCLSCFESREAHQNNVSFVLGSVLFDCYGVIYIIYQEEFQSVLNKLNQIDQPIPIYRELEQHFQNTNQNNCQFWYFMNDPDNR